MKINTNELLYALSKALDCVERDALGVTGNHSKRVAYISMRLCAKLDMNCDQIYDMAACAILHDNALTEFILTLNGKKNIPADRVKEHCTTGELNSQGFPFLDNAKDVILNHHENWDGTGCFNLKENEVSLRAAILRFADNLDLHFSLGKDPEGKFQKIAKHINKFKGKIYSPMVAEVFLDICDTNFLKSLRNENIDTSLRICSPNILQELHYDKLAEIGNVFATIIDQKSKFTLRHSRGIAQKSSIMANFYNFSQEHHCKFVLAANLHDIGKLSIPNAILDKPGNLTKEEFDTIKTHVKETATILSSIKGFKDICSWACGHHEKLDGSGYHQKFKSKNLSFETKLLGCIDIFQALTEDRPYREGMPLPKAFSILDEMVNSKKIDGKIIEDMKTVFNNDELIEKYSQPLHN